MESISSPLNRLHEEGSWFARAHEVRLLVVRCSGDLRKPVLGLVPMFEFHADNRSPWMMSLDAHTRTDEGWVVRSTRLAQDWDRRREAFAADGVTMPAMATIAAAGPHLGGFAQHAAAVATALRPPLDGLVLVLAPALIEDAAVWWSQVMGLVAAPTLQRCRWVIVVDEDLALPHSDLDAMGERAIVCDCSVDPGARHRDLDAMMAAGRCGAPANFGIAAPPGIVAPPRIGDPSAGGEAHRDAVLTSAGIDPAYLRLAPEIRDRVLGAAIRDVARQTSRGRVDAARARDLLASIGLHEHRVISQITLASYLSGAGQPAFAIGELEDAERHADAHGLHGMRSQALLALGLLHALRGHFAEAASAYTLAARTATDAGVPVLAIEAWRLAGQLALEIGQPAQAEGCFSEAIALASNSDPAVAKGSSASEARPSSRQISEQRGLKAQAAALYAQADRFEAAARPPHGGSS